MLLLTDLCARLPCFSCVKRWSMLRLTDLCALPPRVKSTKRKPVLRRVSTVAVMQPLSDKNSGLHLLTGR